MLYVSYISILSDIGRPRKSKSYLPTLFENNLHATTIRHCHNSNNTLYTYNVRTRVMHIRNARESSVAEFTFIVR